MSFVSVQGGERCRDARVVFCDVVSAVQEVIGHDVEEVQGGAYLGDGGVRERKHVSGQTRDGGGDEFVRAEGRADFGEEEGVSGYFPGFLGVGDFFVVFGVAANGEVVLVDSVRQCMSGYVNRKAIDDWNY